MDEGENNAFRKRENVAFRHEMILHKHLDLFKRYQLHGQNVHDIRLKLEEIQADLKGNHQCKMADIHVLQHHLDRCTIDLRTLEMETLILDRLMERSQSSIIDPCTNRSISFMSGTRACLNLFDVVATQVSMTKD